MNFGHPRVLWLTLVLIPLLAWFLWWTWRRRRAAIAQFVQNPMLAELSVGVASGIQKLRRVLLVISVAFLLLTLARPQWGFTWEEAAHRGRDILIAIDTSRSMLAADVQPNRLARAKLATLDLQKLSQYDRLGLIAFAGSAFLQCPLTLDEEAFRQSIQILDPGIIPQGGTAIGEAIETARTAFANEEGENHKVLVLFTDGEDHEQKAIEMAERAAAEGIRIFTVGVGTPAGELLQVRDQSGKLVYVKDTSGNVVKSRLDQALLQQIATVGGGFYLPLQGSNPMEVLYQKGLAPMPTTERSTRLMKRLREQFYWPLIIAIVLLISELFLPDRKRAVRKTDQSPFARKPAAVAALLLVSIGLGPDSSASPATALKNYRAENYKDAQTEYERLLQKDPKDTRLQYNAGAAAYQAKEYDAARRHFEAATTSEDLSLQHRAFYNLANSEFRHGEENPDPQAQIASWTQALKHYEAALKLKPEDSAAQHNREVVAKKLEELKQQQQQQKQQNDNKDQEKKESEEQQENQQNQQGQDKEKQEQKDNSEENKQDQNQQSQQDQQKSEQEKQEQQAKNEQEQQQQNKQEQDQQQQANNQSKSGNGEKEDPQQDPQSEAEQQAQFAQLGQMTPAQARQLLDAQKDEEKALLFIPQGRKADPKDRTFKDW